MANKPDNPRCKNCILCDTSKEVVKETGNYRCWKDGVPGYEVEPHVVFEKKCGQFLIPKKEI